MTDSISSDLMYGNIKVFLGKIRLLIKSNATMKTEDLIRLLNPKIRGWANYYRHVVSKATFNYVDACIFKALMRWIDRRHPEKSAAWKNKRYFRVKGMSRWTFSVKTKNRKGEYYFLDLFRMTQLSIRRHIKIRAEANPYDPQYADYFSKRKRLKIHLRVQDQEFLKT